MGGTIIFVAKGFDNPYKKAVDEIADIDASGKNRWHPSTQDFKATALHSTGIIYEITDGSQFFRTLNGYKGKIGRIVVIGHGNPGEIAFSGVIIPGHVAIAQSITSATLASYTSMFPNIQSKLEKTATIDILACNIGADVVFMREFATAFNRGIRAPSSSVYWTVETNKTNTLITKRGIVSLDNSTWCTGFNSLVWPPPVNPPTP